MATDNRSLIAIFEGWESYQQSLVNAVAPLSAEHLAWRPAPTLRSAGQIAAHISLGRIDWFSRMAAPGSAELAKRVQALGPGQTIAESAPALVEWLGASWQMVEHTLREWTVADLAVTYRQPYQGVIYAVSRQWTIWRILAHDLHHGGELALTLGLQGIPTPDLGDQGGHLNQPPVAES